MQRQKNYEYKCYEKKNTNKKRNRIQQTFTHPHWQSFTIEPLGGQDVFQVHLISSDTNTTKIPILTPG